MTPTFPNAIGRVAAAAGLALSLLVPPLLLRGEREPTVPLSEATRTAAFVPAAPPGNPAVRQRPITSVLSPPVGSPSSIAPAGAVLGSATGPIPTPAGPATRAQPRSGTEPAQPAPPPPSLGEPTPAPAPSPPAAPAPAPAEPPPAAVANPRPAPTRARIAKANASKKRKKPRNPRPRRRARPAPTAAPSPPRRRPDEEREDKGKEDRGKRDNGDKNKK